NSRIGYTTSGGGVSLLGGGAGAGGKQGKKASMIIVKPNNGRASFGGYRNSFSAAEVKYKASTAYEASLPDEVAVEVGDTISIEKEFDDGWAKGKNWTTGKTGIFPKAVLD
ncbi:hypothetical protein HK102_012051, partial [Quaeritorhiza haematococci]